ncbi:MAG: agmatine deiminase family protein [Thermoplasmatales archaeon]|nr:MAG: agmatine deiminase family protein [Thermoplasmatales archaeon]
MNKKILIIVASVSLFISGTINVSSTQTNNAVIDDSLFEQYEQWINSNPESLPIWLTPEELTRLDEIGKGFIPTSEPPKPVRQPAEFEPMQGVLIRYPFGISYNVIAEMSEDLEVVTIVEDNTEKNYVISQYQFFGVNINNCDFLLAPSNSYWTRDYGPWFIFNGNDEQGIVDFIYNRPRPDDNLIPIKFGNAYSITVYGMGLEHAGGNYMTDGQGIAVSTDLVWSENPGYSHEEIDQMFQDYCGIETYHVVPDALGEYIKHIDCWAKLLAPDVIMIIKTSTSHSQYDEIEDAVEYFENQTSCYGTPYKIERVYTHLSEPYINCLILNNKVFVPITSSSWDDEAIASYENAMPGYEVLGFTGSWQSTDALHCRAKGIVDRYMLYIEHTPLSGDQYDHDGFNISARIFPYSGEDLISESTGVYWKVEGGSWNFVEMEALGDNKFSAIIPSQEDGTIIYYYIHAEDDSGRVENHPYIGESWAHSFIANIVNEPPEIIELEGPTEGKTGEEYTYSVSAVDPDYDIIYIKWNWDDGNITDWLGPFESGQEIFENHTWINQGSYNIEVTVKDEHGAEETANLEITIPRNRLESNYIFIDYLAKIFDKYLILMERLYNILE